MANGDFSSTVGSIFKGMDAFLASKTVVGEPIRVGDNMTIIPLVDVNIGMGAGAYGANGRGSNSAGGGMGGKLSPTAVLVVQDGDVRIVPVASGEASALSKVMDMIPTVKEKVTDYLNKKKGPTEEENKLVEDTMDALSDEEF